MTETLLALHSLERRTFGQELAAASRIGGNLIIIFGVLIHSSCELVVPCIEQSSEHNFLDSMT
jgi:hypothetical protein